MVETLDASAKPSAASRPGIGIKSELNRPKPIRDITGNHASRFSTGLRELDRVLGGGIVNGELILVV